ncbi:MAG: hypothetical protein HY696_08245 [Deltaproteobacteria bacterium]|nr:hypothetical protein [Deltaproteobacteria bacterium]
MKRTIYRASLHTMVLLLAGIWLGACDSGTSDTGTGSSGGSSGSVTASAGADQDALLGATVTLDGSGSTAGATPAWSFTSSPSGSSAALSGADSLTPTFVPDVVGSYVVQLSLNSGASTDSVTITAKSVVATVAAGSGVSTRTRFGATEYVVDLGNSAALSAETSQGSVASYAWEQISGPSATATGGAASATLSFTAPTYVNFLSLTGSDQFKWQLLPISRDDLKLVFLLTVTDSSGNTDKEVFTVHLQDSGSEIHTTSGLPNVGLGTSVILSGPSLKAPATAITDWSWSLSRPSGSSATFMDSGATTSTVELPKFVPDVAGLYTVTYTSTSASASGSIQINAGSWVGVGTVGGTTAVSPQCANCHDGTVEPDVATGWAATVHAAKFENSVDSYDTLAPTPYLWEYHTVGYNDDASNSGFDDLASTAGLTFPEAGMTFSEFTSQYATVAKLANVQCENCHGPGDQHTGDPLRTKYSASQYGVCGQCHQQEAEWINSAHNSTGVVHGSGAYQSYWVSNTGCVRCHAAQGFIGYVEEGDEGIAAVTETGAFPGITCAACHDPHSAANAKQLRRAGNVTMVADGSTVDAGKAAVCYTCHDGNYSHDEYDCDTDADGITGSSDSGNTKCTTHAQTAAEYWRGGYHYNVQSPMLEGKQAIADLNGDGTNDLTLDENSFHTSSSFTLAGVTGDTTLSSTNDKCITCHMATGPTNTAEGFQHLGGHAFKLRTGHSIGHLAGSGEEEGESESESAGELELVSACTACHSSLTEINRTARADYDGDGSQEGVQDEVKGLLLNVSTKLKALDTANINQSTTSTNTNIGTTESSGVITVGALGWTGSCSGFTSTSCKPAAGTGSCTNVKAGLTRDDYQQCNFLDASATMRRAVWNYNSVVRDGSLGIHNAAYTVQVLQETYKAVSILVEGDSSSTTYKTDYPNATLR